MAEKPKIPPQVVYSNDIPRIVVPESVTFAEAALYCAAKAKEEDEVAPFPIQLDATLPWGAAFALQQLLAREYSATPVQGECSEMTVRTSRGPVTLRWGAWLVAGLGRIDQGMSRDQANGRMDYRLLVRCKRKLSGKFEDFRAKFLAEVAKRELYSGSALALEVLDEDKGVLDMRAPLQAIAIDPTGPEGLILTPTLAAAVRAEVFFPITHAAELKRAGLPTRRGIMLAGRPGTGKTLTARVASNLALSRGWTVFYLSNATGLPEALRLAQSHGPALLVAEDIDRTLAGARNTFTDEVLNALDGLDRSAELVFLATSNDPSKLPAPLLRPGRLDSFLTFEAPDWIAAHRLVELYAHREVDAAIGRECEGLLSAAIREVVARATLHACALRGESMPTLEDFRQAAHTVRAQQRILEAAESAPKSPAPLLRLRMEESENGENATRGEREFLAARLFAAVVGNGESQ